MSNSMRFIRRIPGSCMIVLLVLLSCIQSSQAAVSSDPNSPLKITAVFHCDYPPVSFWDKNTDKASGFLVEMTDGIASRAGLQVKHICRNGWPEIIGAIESGEADVGVLIRTAEREKRVLFSDPLESTYLAFFARTQSTIDPDRADGFTVAAVRGSRTLEFLKKRSGLKLRVENSYQIGLFSLLAGEVDLFAGEEATILSGAREAGLEDRIKVTGKRFAEGNRCFVMRKGNMQLLALLNRALPDLKASPEYQRIYSKWYGKPKPYWTVRRALTFSGISLIIVVFSMSLWRYLSVLKINRNLVEQIAERKQAEEKLRATEGKYRRLIETTNTGYVIIDCNGLVMDANEEYVRLTGRERLDEVVGHKVLEWTAPSDLARNASEVHACEEWGAVRNLEIEYLGPDGKTTPIEINATLIRTADGSNILTLCRDITERKRSEQERLDHLWFFESMDRVNRAMQGTSDLEQMMSNVLNTLLSLFGCDRAGLAFPCDPAAASWQVIMERTRPEYTVISARGAIPMSRAAATMFQLVLESDDPVQFGTGAGHPLPPGATENFGVRSFVMTAIYPRLSQPWLFGMHQCSHPRVWTQKETRLFREIGRRLSDTLTGLLTQRELRESEKKYRTLFEESFDGLFVTSPDGRILDMNKKGVAMFGYETKEEILRLDLARDIYYHPPDRQRIIAMVNERGTAEYEVDCKKKSGKKMTAYCALSAVKGPDNAISLYRGIIRDITERKKAEEMLRNYAHRLRTLSSRLMEARESERRHIAHELHDEIGQSLTVVKLSLDAIRRNANDATASRLLGVQEELNELMVRVRDLSLNLRPALLDTLGLLPTLQWHFKRFTEQTEIQVNFVHDCEGRRFSTEIETGLFRIIQESLTNVARHAGVAAVSVSLATTDRAIVAVIEDIGAGFQLKDVMEKGRTMGLAGLYERVDDLGGTLTILSHPGAGTHMTVSIPLANGLPVGETRESAC